MKLYNRMKIPGGIIGILCYNFMGYLPFKNSLLQIYYMNIFRHFYINNIILGDPKTKFLLLFLSAVRRPPSAVRPSQKNKKNFSWLCPLKDNFR